MKIVIKKSDGTLSYVHYVLDAKTFDQKPYDKMDELLKKEQDNVIEKYRGMTVRKGEYKVHVFYDFE